MKNHEKIIPLLNNNLQDIYRKALDADAQLATLKSQGMAKFTSIFPEQSLFRCNDKQFMPYVAELSEDINCFSESPEDQQTLKSLLKKMEQLLTVLNGFKTITKSN